VQLSSARLFYALLVGMVCAPLQDPSGWSGVLFRGFMVFLLLAALTSVAASRRQMRLASGLGLLSVTLNLYVTLSGNTQPVPLALGGLISFAFLVAGVHIHKVMYSRRVNADTIYSALNAYLVVAIGFSAAYLLVSFLDADAFSGQLHTHRLFPNASPSDMFYFSIVTMTTAGYGDIMPVEPISRMVAGLEMLFGTLYPTVILARLVGLHSSSLAAREPELPDL
jgi:hypothetical protein